MGHIVDMICSFFVVNCRHGCRLSLEKKLILTCSHLYVMESLVISFCFSYRLCVRSSISSFLPSPLMSIMRKEVDYV